ncbi:protein IMPACT-B-like isoform X2 [Lycorma delicatula]|uniref:protein IMPACT-B-like isoform X2 n=1 Tax=Lycorma delicatula TaxID=130591 RepID=UPI003F513655
MLLKKVDEIESLSSIYDKDWRTEDEACRSYAMNVTNSVTLYVTLPPNYPSQAPPTYQISAPELSHDEKNQISRVLEETYLENIGETVIFQWIEAVKTYLNNKSDLLENLVSLTSMQEINNDTLEYTYNIDKGKDKKEKKNLPKITHGEIVVDRKSTFQGHTACVSSVEDVKCVLSELYENKKIANATHNMYAYRILKEGGKCMLQDFEDDGESQAGKRLLQLLQIMDVTNAVVVVSRWYGGIHLGPDRFRHINNAARQVLLSSGIARQK